MYLFQISKTISEAELGWVRGEEGFSTLAPPRSEGGGGSISWWREGGVEVEKKEEETFENVRGLLT